MGLDRTPTGGRLSFTALGAVTPQYDYTFHFPDGNASIARLLVRSLVPAAIPGHTAEDIVTASTDYSQLDSSSSPIKIRLSSTVVRVRHLGDPASAKEVEITYSSPQGQLSAVKGKAVVMACWNTVTSFICPELPEKQKEALKYGAKVPLVYTVVAVRNWSSFSRLGTQRVATPGMYHTSIGLDQPVSIGGYECPKKPEDPMRCECCARHANLARTRESSNGPDVTICRAHRSRPSREIFAISCSAYWGRAASMRPATSMPSR